MSTGGDGVHPLARVPVVGPLARRVYVRAAFFYLGVVRPWIHRRLRGFARVHDRSVADVTRRNTRRAYERLYGDEELVDEYLGSERIAFYEEVADAVAALDPRRVLDVGCGTGHLLRAVAERRPHVELVGVDYSANAIERARAVVPRASLLVADATRLALAERYDVVLCTEVLEHVKRPTAVVRSLVRATAPGGRIVITVPDGALDTWEGHQNFWTQDELRAFLKVVGSTTVRRLDGGNALLAVVSPGTS